MKRQDTHQLLFKVGDSKDMLAYAKLVYSLQCESVQFETERDGEWISIWIG